MDTLQKVVWSEGMFLAPHHFQQQDRYHEHRAWQQLRAVQPLAYGLSELRIDEDALAFGDLVISRAAGIMPDGLVFSMPDVDDLAATRSLGKLFDRKGAAFDAGDGPQGVYLAAPLLRPGLQACAEDGLIDGQPTRYRPSAAVLRDEFAGANEVEVVTAHKNLRVLLEGESLENHAVLKIAELQRDPTGNRVVLNPDYIPPLLALGASPRLQTLVRHVLEKLGARARELADQQRAGAGGQVEIVGSQAANFLLLQLINTYLPSIRHWYNQSGCHPERIFVELSRLAGGLCSFAVDVQATDLPRYLHDDLGEAFLELEGQLDELLDIIIPTRCTTIRLRQLDNNQHECELPPELLAGEVGFYLGLHGNVATGKLINEAPLKVKIASPEAIRFLVAQSLRGVGLQHLSVPPAELPVKPDWTYYQVVNAGEQWNEVVSAGQVSIFVPAEFGAMQVELLAVK